MTSNYNSPQMGLERDLSGKGITEPIFNLIHTVNVWDFCLKLSHILKFIFLNNFSLGNRVFVERRLVWNSIYSLA